MQNVVYLGTLELVKWVEQNNPDSILRYWLQLQWWMWDITQMKMKEVLIVLSEQVNGLEANNIVNVSFD